MLLYLSVSAVPAPRLRNYELALHLQLAINFDIPSPSSS
jgi:hypothetical protein